MALAWTLAGLLAGWAAVDALTTPYGGCDNIAGTCLRQRQYLAIGTIRTAAVLSTLTCLGIAWFATRARPLHAGWVLGAATIAAAAAAYLALDPISALNDSRTGWLAR